MVGLVSKERLALSALLLILLTLLVYQAATTGVTMDEPNPMLAPLLKIVTGWIPAAWAVDFKDPFY